MAVTPLHFGSPHLDFSRKFARCSATCSSCGSNMYTAERVKTPSITNMEKIYLADHVLREEGNVAPPMKGQKEGIMQTILNRLTDIGGNLSRLQTLFFPRMNSPLSVTVVDNEGIITPELFGNSLGKPQLSTGDKAYTWNTIGEKSLNIMGKIQDFFSETKESPTVNGFDQTSMGLKKFYPYDHDDVKIHWDDKNINIENFMRDDMHSDITGKNNSAMESHSPPYDRETETSNNKTDDNFCIMEIGLQDSDKDTLDKERNPVSNGANIDDEDVSVDTESFFMVHTSDVPPEPVGTIQKTAMSTRLSDLCRKWHEKWHDATDRFNRKTEEPVCDSEIPVKRLYLSRQRKKANIVAMVRGRGRAKSQLRRSGVSQTRHRKETKHIKHGLDINIRNDHEIWQDIEMYHTVQNDHSPDSPNSLDGMVDYDALYTAEFVRQATNPVIFNFSDITISEEKPNARDSKIKQKAARYSTRMHYVPDTSKDIDGYHECYNDKMYDLHRNLSRSRLISESSVDSEDSFCIVFDSESDTDSTIDIIDHDETNYEDEEDKDDKFIVQKVRFNLIPIVHTMVQWDYAYRAARKGPWEELARDRERFRGRINCIAAVLNPILTSQHRSNVWQNRFALQE